MRRLGIAMLLASSLAGFPAVATAAPSEAEEGEGDEGVDPGSPREEKDREYFFVGLRYRHIFVPTWVANLFANVEQWDGAANPAFGPEFTYRRNNFEIVGSIWYASFGANRGFFRGAGDPVTSMEAIDSSLWALIFSADFVWTYPFSDVFAFTYGFEVGLAPVLGSLTRQEAYPEGGGWRRCPGEGEENTEYCEAQADGGTYGRDENGSGGDVPSVFPWVALLRIGVRIKPHRNFMARIEGGLGIGFFFGLSANYGI